ncbi:hypothetical protein [Brevibacillus formosus]|uniref:hypothetical protein n=1 Tax=Brevibacillus formosus TaxID=54913 RepID=UPI003F1E0E88
MSKWVTSFTIAVILLLGQNNLAIASNLVNHGNQLFKVPFSKSGNQWSISIGQAELDSSSLKPVSGKYDVYSLALKNTGETVYNVRIEAYKTMPDEQTKLRLFSVPVKSEFHTGEGMTVHQNFPIGVDAKELEIDVYWEVKQDHGRSVNGLNVARTWKQVFSFKPNNRKP